MKTRYKIGLVFATIAAIGGFVVEARAVLLPTTCTISAVGWRDNIKALKTVCGSNTFWNRESVGNSTCTLKTSMDAVKLFQATANAALLSGKQVTIWYDTQGGCNTSDLVIREMYLLN